MAPRLFPWPIPIRTFALRAYADFRLTRGPCVSATQAKHLLDHYIWHRVLSGWSIGNYYR